VFGIDSTELLLIVIVAVVVIGPKDLPRALYKLGQIVGQARGMARHFRTGIDAMVREVELEELQKQWARDNARIMAEHPMTEVADEMKPLADETAGAALPAPEAAADEWQPYVAEESRDEAVAEPAGPPETALPDPSLPDVAADDVAPINRAGSRGGAPAA